MTFETATYAAPSFDFALTLEAQDAQGALERAGFTYSLAAFLLRLAAYFQGCLSSLPRASHNSITLIDHAMDKSPEPLIKVRMNRHLSRRLRWLIKRGRVETSGNMRMAVAADEARCNLTPGQFMEYCFRVHRQSRVRLYGLGLGRRALRLCAIFSAALQGEGAALRRAGLCAAPLAPD